MSSPVTIIVHGTFASQADWWKLGTGETFADRLESVLSEQGMCGTVWQPVLKAGLSYEHFAWSGENSHRARVAAGRHLAQSLQELAQRCSASPASPLQVNMIAHSHGGNVALEALRHMGDTVRVRRLVCLGTPLISFRPALRILRPFTVSFLTLFMSIFAFLPFIVIPTLVRYIQGIPLNPEEHDQLLGAIVWPVIIPMFGWILLGLNRLVDLLWAGLCWGWLLMIGKTNGQAYGPAPQKLARDLDGKQVLVLTSHFDEADLFLQLSAAPAELYKEFARTKYSGWQAYLERIIFRPAVIGLLLHPAELVLERFVLGVSWLRLLLFDYDTTWVRERGAYPPAVFHQVDLTKELHLEQTLLRQNPAPTLSFNPFGDGTSLGRRLHAVGQGLSDQIRLRHAMYYQNVYVLNLVSSFLTKD